MKNNNNWFWGLFFICAGGVLIASQIGYFTGVSVFTLALTLLLIPLIIKSVINLNWGGILFPLAFLLIMYKESLGLYDLSTWAILLAALFGTIGLSMIFGSNQKRKFFGGCNVRYGPGVIFKKDKMYGLGNKEEDVNNGHMNYGYEEDDIINVKSSFSETTKYVHSQNLKKVFLETSFGALQVFFDNAKVSSEGAEIYVDANFGGVELYLPKEWNVENKVNATIAGVEEKNKAYGNNGPKVIVYGNANFSGVQIIYI